MTIPKTQNIKIVRLCVCGSFFLYMSLNFFISIEYETFILYLCEKLGNHNKCALIKQRRNFPNIILINGIKMMIWFVKELD